MVLNLRGEKIDLVIGRKLSLIFPDDGRISFVNEGDGELSVQPISGANSRCKGLTPFNSPKLEVSCSYLNIKVEK
jgi:hypothetical protein